MPDLSPVARARARRRRRRPRGPPRRSRPRPTWPSSRCCCATTGRSPLRRSRRSSTAARASAFRPGGRAAAAVGLVAPEVARLARARARLRRGGRAVVALAVVLPSVIDPTGNAMDTLSEQGAARRRRSPGGERAERRRRRGRRQRRRHHRGALDDAAEPGPAPGGRRIAALGRPRPAQGRALRLAHAGHAPGDVDAVSARIQDVTRRQGGFVGVVVGQLAAGRRTSSCGSRRATSTPRWPRSRGSARCATASSARRTSRRSPCPPAAG